MWRSILFLIILSASSAIGWCTSTIDFTVDPANTGILYQGPTVVSLSSSGLDGTVLAGQSLSLDLVLTDEVLARISVPDPSAFGTLLIVFTDAPTYPGFAGSTTGYLLDPRSVSEYSPVNH